MTYNYKNIIAAPKRLLVLAKKRYILSTVSVLILAAILFSIFGSENKAVVVKAEKGTVEEEVLVTGKTKSKQEANLGFEVGGKVAITNVEVGSVVRTGEVLVALDQSSLRASLQKAEVDLEKAIETHAVNIREAYRKADDAVRNDVDQFFTNPRTHQAQFDPSIEDGGTSYSGGLSQATISDLSSKRIEIEKMLVQWEASQKTLSKGQDLSQAYQTAQDNLRAVQNFLDQVAMAINSLDSVDFQYEATIQGYKNTVGDARSKVNTALSTLINGAKIESLRADVSSIEASLAKTVIRSPISGTITRLEVEKGEIVTSGTTIVSVISEKELQIEANVSEINIGKLRVGNEVVITLDAFPSETYSGEVFYIDPGETIIDRVPTYKISVKFVGPVDSKLRSGLTANLSIVTRKVENAIKIPIYAVERQGDKDIVRVRGENSDKIEEREVILGLLGKDGTVEIISGLLEGEEVVADL